MKEFFSPLHRLGFKRTHRGRGAQDCHIYTKEYPQFAGTYPHNGLPKTTVIEVQLWFDHRHRASYMLDSKEDRTPLGFNTPLAMEHAVDKLAKEIARRFNAEHKEQTPE